MTALIIFLALAVITLLVWKLWKPTMKPKQKVEPNQANLYFFYTEWCGFSQKAMPEWEKVEESLKMTPIFGKTRVTPVRVNAEEDRKTATLYEVEGYPTILLETEDSIYTFSGRRSHEGLLEFLRNTLGKERESL
jgi:thiol-disulfide isomerase/thioredoxin